MLKNLFWRSRNCIRAQEFILALKKLHPCSRICFSAQEIASALKNLFRRSRNCICAQEFVLVLKKLHPRSRICFSAQEIVIHAQAIGCCSQPTVPNGIT
ncbi:hypothetical protein NSQ43_00015 [Sporosarcina sp. FSL W8-0480]|uniref:hypothetical protein n=1 Tax=Sporosarcina sp. FSL W8-0480 TaxID=2954701 RepID=UPI0030DC8E65